MPNWCENTLTVSGPISSLLDFIDQAEGPVHHFPNSKDFSSADSVENTTTEGESSLFSFQRLVPLPKDVLLSPDYSNVGYQAEKSYWGVKWGACGEITADGPHISQNSQEAYITYNFDTAWSPPVFFLDTLSKSWPRLSFSLTYIVEGDEDEGDYIIDAEVSCSDAEWDLIQSTRKVAT